MGSSATVTSGVGGAELSCTFAAGDTASVGVSFAKPSCPDLCSSITVL